MNKLNKIKKLNAIINWLYKIIHASRLRRQVNVKQYY